MRDEFDMILDELREFKGEMRDHVTEIKSELKGLHGFKMKITGSVATLVIAWEVFKAKVGL